MTIRPITSVSFNGNYNRLSFEGRKNNSGSSRMSSISSTLKAIPVATLIAMSPLNTSVNLYAQAPVEEKLIMTGNVNNATIPDALGKMKECGIDFISTDGNDNNIEKVRLRFVDWHKGKEIINGKSISGKYAFTTMIDVKNLELCKEIRKYSGSPDQVKERYYVSGPGDYSRSLFFDEEDNSYRKGVFSRKSDNLKEEISKEFYDYLVDLFKDADMVENKTTTKIIHGDAETDALYESIFGIF